MIIPEEILKGTEEYEWDKGNIKKSWEKQRVHFKECEQAFSNLPLLINFDKKHSKREKRFHALGKTDKRRRIFIAFTIRKQKLRVISARPMSKRERSVYDRAEKA